jgi:hypothetical protein
MARVVALIPDLLFGSNVLGALRAQGLDVQLLSSGEGLASALADTSALVVDLTGDVDPETIGSLRAAGTLGRVKTLGFYSHVDAEIKQRAEAAGFDLVIPRSRMAREGAQLVARLLADA